MKIGSSAGVGGLGGVLGPDPGVAVGLQFERHRELVLACRVALHLPPHLGLGAEQVLHVVAVLVGQHVRLGELRPRRRTGWPARPRTTGRCRRGRPPGSRTARRRCRPAPQPVFTAWSKKTVSACLVRDAERLRQRRLPVVLDRVDVERVAALDVLSGCRSGSRALTSPGSLSPSPPSSELPPTRPPTTSSGEHDQARPVPPPGSGWAARRRPRPPPRPDVADLSGVRSRILVKRHRGSSG